MKRRKRGREEGGLVQQRSKQNGYRIKGPSEKGR